MTIVIIAVICPHSIQLSMFVNLINIPLDMGRQRTSKEQGRPCNNYNVAFGGRPSLLRKAFLTFNILTFDLIVMLHFPPGRGLSRKAFLTFNILATAKFHHTRPSLDHSAATKKLIRKKPTIKSDLGKLVEI